MHAPTTAAILAVLALNCGCVFFHGFTVGRPIDEVVLKNLAVGEADKLHVEEELGLPNDIIPLGDGTIYRYDYTKANTFLLLIFGHTSEEHDKVYMLFDGDGFLVDTKEQHLTKDLGWRLWPFGR